MKKDARTLSAIFDKHLALRTIRFNPVTLAERMARGSNEVGENDEIDVDALEVRPEEVYGPDQILKLIQSAKPGLAQTILTTFPLTGVRHGEGLALMWRDIDFDQNGITIRRNWSGRYRDGEPVFYTPKTKHSIRKIRIPGELSLALKKWKLQCPPSKWDLVFPRADGRPQDRKTTWHAFDAAIKQANENTREDENLRRLRIHSLRHSFASIHLMNGTPIPEVSAMFGHANVNITLTVYTHFIPKMQTDSAKRLAAAIFSGEEPVSDQVDYLRNVRSILKATAMDTSDIHEAQCARGLSILCAIGTTPTVRLFCYGVQAVAMARAKEYAVHYARRDTCHRREVGNWAAPATGWLLESIKRVAGEGEETEEIKIKRPGAVRPEEDKET